MYYIAEVVESLRRVILCGLFMVVTNDPSLRVFTGFLLSLGFAILTNGYNPFTSPMINALSAAAGWQISFTFLMAYPFNNPGLLSLNQELLSGFLLMITLATFVLAFIQQSMEAKSIR